MRQPTLGQVEPAQQFARPDLVFYQVPVEPVQLVQGQQVQHLEDEGHREEVAADIKQDTTPYEAGRIQHLQAQAQQHACLSSRKGCGCCC